MAKIAIATFAIICYVCYNIMANAGKNGNCYVCYNIMANAGKNGNCYVCYHLLS